MYVPCFSPKSCPTFGLCSCVAPQVWAWISPLWKDFWGADKKPPPRFLSQFNWRSFSFLQMFLLTSQLETQKRPGQVIRRRSCSHIFASISLFQRTVPLKYVFLISPANICPEVPCYGILNTVLTHCWTSQWAGEACREEEGGMPSALLVQIYNSAEKVLQDLLRGDLGNVYRSSLKI